MAAGSLYSKLTARRSELVFEPLPEDDPKQRQPDVTRAKEELGWDPKTSLEEGLKERPFRA